MNMMQCEPGSHYGALLQSQHVRSTGGLLRSHEEILRVRRDQEGDTENATDIEDYECRRKSVSMEDLLNFRQPVAI